MNKKILIALGISLALNFFFVGFGVSRFVFHPAEHRFAAFKWHDEHHEKHKEKMFRGDKNDFFAPTREERKKMHEKMKRMKEVHCEIVRLVSAEVLDEQALQAAFDKSAELNAEAEKEMREGMLAKIKTATPEERRSFAKRFGKPFFKKDDMMRGKRKSFDRRREGPSPYRKEEGKEHKKHDLPQDVRKNVEEK